MTTDLTPKEAEVADRLHRLLTTLRVDFEAWQLDCLAVELAPAIDRPMRNVQEVESVLAARTEENRHLRAEVARLKREDWYVRWVFEHAGWERAEAEARRLSERGLALLRTLESANAAAELAGERADRAEDVRSAEVLEEVAAERLRQDEKWGEQNHRNGTGDDRRLLGDPALPTFGTLAYRMKAHVDMLARCDLSSTWASILLEEVFEALAEDDPAKVRAELVQVAAVATQWVEAIDRRRAQVEQVARIFDVPTSLLAGPSDADPVSGDGFAEVTGAALYVDGEGA